MRRAIALNITILPLALLLSGCAFGVTNLRVAHSPLKQIADKKSGTLIVRTFVDNRKQDKQYIGTKRNGFGMALGDFGIRDGKHVDALVTEYFVEALQAAGYTAIIQDKGTPASNVGQTGIVEGQINEFWLDLYMATWHKVDVLVRLKDKSDQKVLWEKNIKGGEANVLWIGVNSEFEKVIRQALDQALNRAAQEFASDEFYQAIQNQPSVNQ